MMLAPPDAEPVRRGQRSGEAMVAPGGPHDPEAPDRLEPVPGAAPAHEVTEGAPDEVGPGPEGDDPMQGDAPSG